MNPLSIYKYPFLKDCIKIYKEDGNEVVWDLNFFPDGQIQVKIKKDYLVGQYFSLIGSFFNPATSISTSKWPILQTMA